MTCTHDINEKKTKQNIQKKYLVRILHEKYNHNRAGVPGGLLVGSPRAKSIFKSHRVHTHTYQVPGMDFFLDIIQIKLIISGKRESVSYS